jgi:hypothetical protein
MFWFSVIYVFMSCYVMFLPRKEAQCLNLLLRVTLQVIDLITKKRPNEKQ